MDDCAYSVLFQDRIRALLGDEYELTEKDTLTYVWRRGYEKLNVSHVGGGSLEYAGSYHPNDGLCEGNPCRWCGKAFYEE